MEWTATSRFESTAGTTDEEYDPADLARVEVAVMNQSWLGPMIQLRGLMTSWLVRTVAEIEQEAHLNEGVPSYLPTRGFSNDDTEVIAAVPVEVNIYPEVVVPAGLVS